MGKTLRLKYASPSEPPTPVQFDELARYVPRLEAELRRQYRAERRRAPGTFHPFLDALEEFTLRGGKRFRALLVLAGFHLASGRRPDPALRAAAAMEQFQSWMLIHDDIIDHSAQRRGGPTLHRAMEARHSAERFEGSSSSFGDGVGITLGDLQEPYTVAALLSAPVPSERRLAALDEYVRMTRATALGQLLDIQNSVRPVGDVTERDVLLVHELKSAVYTVSSPLRIGAILAGGRAGLLTDLDRIGIDLGIAFQLRDDVLGTGFDAGAAGKSANDLVEGKRTLLVVRAWATAGADGRAAISEVLGHADAPGASVERAREVIRASGSLGYSEERIRALAQRAARRIRASRYISATGRGLLGEISEKLVQRKT